MTDPQQARPVSAVPRFVQEHIRESRMQRIVILAALGGFGIMRAAMEGLRTRGMTQEEREALGNVPKVLLGGALAYGIYYVLDIDRRWLTVERASKALEQRLE